MLGLGFLDLYIMSLAIVGSILLYPVGNIDYIDALFFGSGCATQSGLNTFVAMAAPESAMLTLA